MKLNVAAALVASFGLATASSAQTNFGEFVDMGATKVLNEEWKSLLPAYIRAITPQGSDAALTFHANGTLSGEIILKQGAKSKVTGKWTMDANGRRCIEEYFEAWQSTYKECSYMYRLNGKYYGTSTDSDRSAPVRNPLVPYEIRKR